MKSWPTLLLPPNCLNLSLTVPVNTAMSLLTKTVGIKKLNALPVARAIRKVSANSSTLKVVPIVARFFSMRTSKLNILSWDYSVSFDTRGEGWNSSPLMRTSLTLSDRGVLFVCTPGRLGLLTKSLAIVPLDEFCEKFFQNITPTWVFCPWLTTWWLTKMPRSATMKNLLSARGYPIAKAQKDLRSAACCKPSRRTKSVSFSTNSIDSTENAMGKGLLSVAFGRWTQHPLRRIPKISLQLNMVITKT